MGIKLYESDATNHAMCQMSSKVQDQISHIELPVSEYHVPPPQHSILKG